MCTHLDMTGATYYFRRLAPVDLIGCFTTATGNPRTGGSQAPPAAPRIRNRRPH